MLLGGLRMAQIFPQQAGEKTVRFRKMGIDGDSRPESFRGTFVLLQSRERAAEQIVGLGIVMRPFDSFEG